MNFRLKIVGLYFVNDNFWIYSRIIQGTKTVKILNYVSEIPLPWFNLHIEQKSGGY
jgi:hypothetical protein